MKGIKVLLGVITIAVVLVGCAGGDTTVWETVDDGGAVLASTPRYDVTLSTPADSVETFSEAGSQIYTQNQGDYTITVETMQAESPDAMLKVLTGLEPERLTVMTTWQDGMPRYDLTWACAGETGLMVCRGAVIDDGSHYYTVLASIPEELTARYSQTVEECLAGLRLTENLDEQVTAP